LENIKLTDGWRGTGEITELTFQVYLSYSQCFSNVVQASVETVPCDTSPVQHQQTMCCYQTGWARCH